MPGMSWNLFVAPEKSWQVKAMFGRLVTADVQGRTIR